MHCFFTSDLHGKNTRYETLFHTITNEQPDAVFLGGDLLPTHHSTIPIDTFITHHILTPMRTAAKTTRFFIILGNDDPRAYEQRFQDAEKQGLCNYIHERTVPLNHYTITGYAYVPPTPFLLKDWERFDVSYDTGHGNVSPEEGTHTVPFSTDTLRHGNISEDLEKLTTDLNMDTTMFLFHSPPYDTVLDRAGLDGQMVDHAPLDIHVGSIAIRRFIENHQPHLTLHGHIHEAARLTGQWKTKIGKTHCFNGSTDGPELALIRFDPAQLGKATRELLA